MSQTVFLIRHGLTRSNLRVVYAGRSNEELLPAALDDVIEVAKYLSDKRVTRILSSPLRRAIDTARPLADTLALRIETEQWLTEMHMGPWSGLSSHEIARTDPLN